MLFTMDKSFLGYDPYTTDCSPLLIDKNGVFNIGRIIDRTTATQVIRYLNKLDKDGTVYALKGLFEHFVWNFNNLEGEERKFINIVFIPPGGSGGSGGSQPSRRSRKSRKSNSMDDDIDTDSPSTASTTGYTLWINEQHVMNKDFDKKDTHFGKLPKGVSHYCAVILHEFGHVIRERANETTFQFMLDISPDINRCFREFQLYISDTHDQAERAKERGYKRRSYILQQRVKERKDELEEWIADMFAKSFIIYAMTRTSRPKRYISDRPIQQLKIRPFA